MALVYAVRRNGDLIMVDTADRISKALGITTKAVRDMASTEWRKRHPKAPYSYVIGTRPDEVAKWRPSRANDTYVKRLRDAGMSVTDIADMVGISRKSVEHAISRVENGRYGPCGQ